MAEIITALYDSEEQVTNVVDDLVSTGIPREKIRVHGDAPQVQVMVPETSSPEITEILQRHRPIEIRH
jgi:hypothetical protein